MRRYHDQLSVQFDGSPQTFRWRGRRYQVTQIVGHWVEASAWWRPPSDPTQIPTPATTPAPVHWWRVAAGTGVFDLCRRDDCWTLRVVHD